MVTDSVSEAKEIKLRRLHEMSVDVSKWRGLVEITRRYLRDAASWHQVSWRHEHDLSPSHPGEYSLPLNQTLTDVSSNSGLGQIYYINHGLFFFLDIFLCW